MKDWLKRRWNERSTKIQLAHIFAAVVTLFTGVPAEVALTVFGTIAGIGIVTPDNKPKDETWIKSRL